MDIFKWTFLRKVGHYFYSFIEVRSLSEQSLSKPLKSKIQENFWNKTEHLIKFILKHFSKIPLVGFCCRAIYRPISLVLQPPPEIQETPENVNLISLIKHLVKFCGCKSRVVIHLIVLVICLFCYKIYCYYSKKPKDIENFGGLENNSNFCYMNSMIQALASSEKLLEKLVQIQNDIGNENNNQLNRFIDLLQTINEAESNFNENTNKLNLLMELVNWTKSDQQDTYDLLAFLLNSIEKSIESHEKILMPLKLELIHTFTGINIPNKVQFHLGLSIGLCGKYNERSGVTLNYLIEQYFTATLIDDDPEKTSKLLFFKNPPNLLLLHIQANKWNSEKREMVKPEYYINYEEVLSFDAYIYTENSKTETVKVQYQLTAIVHHMGNISGGHYITYRKWKGNWYLVNDEQVSLVDFKCEICPYILLYEKS